jgi:hypothetical protein
VAAAAAADADDAPLPFNAGFAFSVPTATVKLNAWETMVRRCRLTVSKPALKAAPTVSAISA